MAGPERPPATQVYLLYCETVDLCTLFLGKHIIYLNLIPSKNTKQKHLFCLLLSLLAFDWSRFTPLVLLGQLS